jgi:hypothetical protein
MLSLYYHLIRPVDCSMFLPNNRTQPASKEVVILLPEENHNKCLI